MCAESLADAARFQDVHTARAYKRLMCLDEAFWDGYQSLVASVRPKASQPQPQPQRRLGSRPRRSSTLASLASDLAQDEEYLDAPVNHVVATYPDYLVRHIL